MHCIKYYKKELFYPSEYNDFLLYQRTIINRPLAGTIRRGKTKAEDKVLEQLLLSDEKQCAEHIMLVDLGRNDVGKVRLPFLILFLSLLTHVIFNSF